VIYIYDITIKYYYTYYFVWVRVAHNFSFFVLSFGVHLRSEFRVVMSVPNFNIKTMFGSSLLPVVCRRAHVLFTLFVFAGV